MPLNANIMTEVTVTGALSSRAWTPPDLTLSLESLLLLLEKPTFPRILPPPLHTTTNSQPASTMSAFSTPSRTGEDELQEIPSRKPGNIFLIKTKNIVIRGGQGL